MSSAKSFDGNHGEHLLAENSDAKVDLLVTNSFEAYEKLSKILYIVLGKAKTDLPSVFTQLKLRKYAYSEEGTEENI